MKRDILSEIHDLRLLLLLYGATNHWSGWLDGLARCITPEVADILSKDLDFRRKSLPIPYARRGRRCGGKARLEWWLWVLLLI